MPTLCCIVSCSNKQKKGLDLSFLQTKEQELKNCQNVEDECGLLQLIEKMLLGKKWIAGEYAVNTSLLESHPH